MSVVREKLSQTKALPLPQEDNVDMDAVFSMDFEADADIEVSKSASHDEIVTAVGSLWETLSAVTEKDVSSGETLHAAFTAESLSVARGKDRDLEAALRSARPTWDSCRPDLISELFQAAESGWILETRLHDLLSFRVLTDPDIGALGAILEGIGISIVPDIPAFGSEPLDSTPCACSVSSIEDAVDEHLGPWSAHYDDLVATYLGEAARVPLLTREEERAIAAEIESCRKAVLAEVVRSEVALSRLCELVGQICTRDVRPYEVFDLVPESAEDDSGDVPQDDDELPEAPESKHTSVESGIYPELRDQCGRVADAMRMHRSRSGGALPEVDIAAIVRSCADMRLSASAMAHLIDTSIQAVAESARKDHHAIESVFKAFVAKRNQLVNSNLRLVAWVARKYSQVGMPLGDLIQEGNIGLMRAADRFDHRREARFSTYATWWIRQTIYRSIANDMRVVRVPVHVHERISVLRKMQRLYEAANGGAKASVDWIAKKSGLPAQRVRTLLHVDSPIEQFDFWREISREGTATDISAEMISGSTVPDAFDAAAHEALASCLSVMMADLTERQKEIVVRRFGLNDDMDETLEEIGVDMGVTRERIRQIEAKALKRLRHPTRSYLLREFRMSVPGKGNAGDISG